MVAEDAIITEEVPVEVSVVREEVLVVAVSVATEVQHQEAVVSAREKKVVFQTEHHVKVDLEEEANLEVHQHQDVKVDFHRTALQEDQMLQDLEVFQTEHHVVLKVHQMHQEKEDQEKANIHLLIFL